MGGNLDETNGYAGGHSTRAHNDAAALADERRRLGNFQAKCAAMREVAAWAFSTELARLEKKRSDTCLNIGVTSERMKQTKRESSFARVSIPLHRLTSRVDIGPESASMEAIDTAGDGDATAAAAVKAKIQDLFDNEVLWDADDTDEFILKLFEDLEAAGVHLAALKDLGWNSLLHMTALWNRRVIMEEVIRKGAELNEKNKNGHTPLDLASHWGHFELALQLQHYGGKHTCETERDIAISQRDLAQQLNKECEAEMQSALQRLQRAKQEREEFRIERDRLFQLYSQMVSECNLQADQIKLLETMVNELTDEKHSLRIKAAQLTDELVCEQSARSNAVQGWKIAEKVIADMQRLQEECREREEEALTMRNEALGERDIARGITRQAQIDQGIAKQHQMDAERERDAALKKLLDAESDIARNKEIWCTKIAKIEVERRNIQIEIDRQTELLHSENTKLEKHIAALITVNTRQRQEIEETNFALASLQKQFDFQQRELSTATEKISKLEEQVRVLLDERREEHRSWRQRIEQNLHQTIAAELRSMLEASVSTWRKLHACQELVYAFDMVSLSAVFQTSVFADSASGSVASGLSRLNAATASTPSFKAVLLPVIQDKGALLKESGASPRAPTLLTNLGNNTSSFVNHNYDPPLRFAYDLRIQSKLNQAEETLQLQSEHLCLNTVAEHVAALCASISTYLDALTQYSLKYLEHFRKQAQAQEKMIERKDELIQRFTQHRQEKLKKQNPARFRECSVRPSI